MEIPTLIFLLGLTAFGFSQENVQKSQKTNIPSTAQSIENDSPHVEFAGNHSAYCVDNAYRVLDNIITTCPDYFNHELVLHCADETYKVRLRNLHVIETETGEFCLGVITSYKIASSNQLYRGERATLLCPGSDKSMVDLLMGF